MRYLSAWMAALKESDMLRHADVHVEYVAKNGEILNDGTPLILIVLMKKQFLRAGSIFVQSMVTAS